MLIDVIKANIISATKMRNQLASDILKVVLGECQTRNDFTDDFIIRYCREIVKGNTETMKFGESAKLSRENELLRSYLPKEVIHAIEYEGLTWDVVLWDWSESGR